MGKKKGKDKLEGTQESRRGPQGGLRDRTGRKQDRNERLFTAKSP